MEDVADASIKKARENLTKWEDLSNPIAPISKEDRDTVIELLSVSGHRAYNEDIAHCSATSSEQKYPGKQSSESQQDDVDSKVPYLASAEEFLVWFSGAQDDSVPNLNFAASSDSTYLGNGASSNRGGLMDYVGQLNSHKQECQALLQQLEAALCHLTQLQVQYTSVSTRTTALHTDCEHLLAEQTRLSNTADFIQAKLWYFIQVDSISQKLTSPAFTVTSEGFIPLLAKIDQCIAYMKNNPRCRESSVYLVRYMHCLSRALGLIRIYVTKSLENSTRQVLPKVGSTLPNSDNATVLYYSKFRTNASRIKTLMSEIEDRLVEGRQAVSMNALTSVGNGPNNALNSQLQRQQSYNHSVPNPSNGHGSDSPTNNNSSRSLSSLYKHNQSDVTHLVEYQNLLNDCHQCYFRQRQQLLGPCVSDAVSQLVNNYRKDHCSLVRSGCAFLVHVCEDEHTLYNQFFSLLTPELEIFLEGLCTTLYDGLRPLIIHIDHLETLSELCSILRRGMIEEHLQSNPHQLAALRVVVSRMLEDAQERLVYRAHVYITSDISGFLPSPGDLAYPSKLELMEQIAQEIAATATAARQTALMSRGHSRTYSDAASVVSLGSDGGFSSTGNERFSRVGSSPADLHGMWYPTLRRTLMCLSKLYRCVDKAIFQGVSLDAVSACVQSLRTAGASISDSSSPTHAALFQIKHLLILREQLAPFQVESCLKETSLDWSKLKDAAYGLVQQRANLFSLGSNNALLQFIVDGTPHVTEHLMDSKRDVDKELKKVCERLIQTSTETLMGPLTALLAQIDVILAINEKEGGVKPIQLRNQPFATPDKINELVSKVCRNIRSKLPKLQSNLHLYLANRDTEFILLKPVRINVANSFSRLNKIVNEHYSPDDALIASCPSVDELNMMMNSLLEVRHEGEKRQGSDSSNAAATNHSTRPTAATEHAPHSTGIPAPTGTVDHNTRPLATPVPLAATGQQPSASVGEGPLAGAKENALRTQMVVDEHSAQSIGFASTEASASLQHPIARAEGVDTNALISVTVNGDEPYKETPNTNASQMMQSI